MKRALKKLKTAAVLFLSVFMFFCLPGSSATAAENTEKVTISMIGKYDSADTAAIRSVDTVKKEIRFRNHKTGKTYTLSYDNTSMMYDVRGVVLSASLLEPGQIVDVTFLKSTKHITTLNVNGDAWIIDSTKDHDLVRGDGTARIKGELYKIDQRTLVLADDHLALAEDILATDAIKVSGMDREIYSIVVTSGHGYVSLSSDMVSDQSLVGAWIELDNAVIHRITPNMLLSAPEGDYNLQIIGNGASYQSKISVKRNQETVVDTSKVTIAMPKEGLVTFKIIPESAEVFVDGERVLTGVTQSLKYGYHTLRIAAEGYVTQNKYLKVGTARSVVNIELEKEETENSSSSESSSTAETSASTTVSTAPSSDSSTENSTSDNSAATRSTTDDKAKSADGKTASASGAAGSITGAANTRKVINGYKIYFDEPYGAEVYFDGSYVGQIPISVAKISGSHEVILKKEGHETKSYRISVDTEEVSLNYTFPALVSLYDDDDIYYDDDDDDDDNDNDAAVDTDDDESDGIEIIELDGSDDDDTDSDAGDTVIDDDIQVIDMSGAKSGAPEGED